MLHQIKLIALLLGLYGVLTPAFAAEGAYDTEPQDDDSGPPNCPKGYWCKKKRDYDSAECPLGYLCQTKRGSTEACPPGYWVARRSYWCRRSELVIDKPTNPDECPEG